MSLDCLPVVLEAPANFLETIRDVENGRVDLARICVGVMECFRFERTRDGVSVVLPGCQHPFEILDEEEQEEEPMCEGEPVCEAAETDTAIEAVAPQRDHNEAVAIIQNKWRKLYAARESKRSEEMKWNLARRVIQV
jgi:hypothetical protein